MGLYGAPATLAICVACLASVTSASRILLLPMNHHSHINFFTVVAKSLNEAGHDTRVLVSAYHRKTVEKHGVVPIVLESSTTPIIGGANYTQLEKTVFEHGSDIKAMFSVILQRNMEDCAAVLEDPQTMERLENFSADLAMVEGFDMAHFLYTIPYRLGIPYVTLTPRHDPWTARIPAMPSMEPHVMSGHYLSADSTLYERACSLFMYILL